MIILGWVIVDKDGQMIGIDPDSGGCPYKAYSLNDTKFWSEDRKDDADKYRDIIDYGAKGYRTVPFVFSILESVRVG